MKKTLSLLTLALIFCANFLTAQTWSALPDTLNKPITSAIKTANHEALFAGTFTGTTSGVNSQLCIKYSTATNEFISVSGFDTLTDVVNGFFFRNGTFCAFGKFKKNGLYYGVMKFDANNTTVSPEPHFQFKGAFAPFGKILALGIDDQNNVLIFGDTLANMGPSGMGINLMTAKVARVSSTGTVTALPSLKPTHASEASSIMTFGWNGNWVVLGNFDHLGTTEAFDCGLYDGTNLTPANISSGANLYARGFSSNHLGWNGVTTDGGINSPGGLGLNGNNLEPLGAGWNVNTLSVTGVASNVWYCGTYKNSSGSRIATWNQNSDSWTNRQGNLIPSGNTTDVVGGVVALAGDTMIAFGQLTSFAGMAMTVVTNPPLPVELVSFTARLVENNVLLEWKTASEKNNHGFTVQRSADGVNWINLAFVYGNGTTTEPQQYSYTDDQPLPGQNYYRLKQEDFDGAETFSLIVAVEIKTENFKMYPNPTYRRLNFEFAEKVSEVKIEIFNSDGKKVLEETMTEIIACSLDTRDFLLGTYTVIITTNGVTTAKTLVVTR